MKLYSEHPGASITMSDDPHLREILRAVIRDGRINQVLESGTYRGLGSTTMVAEAFPRETAPARFVTLEANQLSWQEARRNLGRFPFVTCRWGLSVGLEEALVFLSGDECLRDHSRWPDIFIDEINNPLEFYSAEVRGQLGGVPTSTESGEHQGENLLRRELGAMDDSPLLVVLDSAGGIGFLEFSIVHEHVRHRPYWLLLDDIHHLKHFRSLATLRADPAFRIIECDEERGWVLAQHQP